MLIRDDNTAPTQWPKGRVIETYPGSDGLIRVATLKTVKGTIKRPIAKLCLLPRIDQPTKNSSITAVDKIYEEQTNSQQPTIVNNDKPKKKQRQRKTYLPQKSYNLRSRSAISNLTLIVLLAILAMVTGTPFKISTFSDQPGIYFEQISNVRFVSGEWTILVHYNLSTYLQYHTQHQRGIEKMKSLCESITYEQSSCMGVIQQFNERQKELNLGDSFIRANQHINRRKKRSPFDFIGTIASEAFGVLDQRYAEKYTVELEKIKNDDRHLTSLLDKHMSIVQANRVIHHNEEKVTKNLETIERNLDQIKKTYDEAQLNMSEQKRHQIFLLRSSNNDI